jgi:hypothetical protein
MCASRADRKKPIPLSGYDNCFTERMPQKHLSIAQFINFASLREIRPL